MELLCRYEWPGNVRQLENVVERLVILDRSGTITGADLPPEIHARSAGEPEAAFPSLAEQEKRYILKVLDACGDNRSRAARILGLDRSSLWRKLKEYEASS